ncbi:MAG TPA: hypothetical protein VF526_02860 [Solirubrobacteraceae bacterium]
MIATALQAEVADYVERFAEERDEGAKRLVVRGSASSRSGRALCRFRRRA